MTQGALTNRFMLGVATVMIGSMDNLNDLGPDDSIGLVKNFQLTGEPQYQELTQGVKNSIVYSVLTRNDVRAQMEVYEFTAKNLAYGLGLAGTFTTFTDNSTVATLITAAATTVPLHAGDGSKFAPGDYILIKKDDVDNFVIRKVVSIATDTLTVDHALPAIAAGSVVKQVNMISGGSKKEQEFYSAKIAGKLVDGTEVVLLLPKIRIVKGFTMAFTTNDYGNLPFEFTIYDLVAADTLYSQFNGDQFQIFTP